MNKIDKAYDRLRNYSGESNYIKYIKSLYESGKKVLNDFEIEYINKNYDYEITEPNRIIKLTKDCAENLYEKYSLDFIPEKVKITKIIGEMGTSYHCYMKYRQSKPEKLVFISRRGIIGSLFDIDYRTLDLDLSKYDGFDGGKKLFNHQKEGVKFLTAYKKCILADSMGLGKTITATVSAHYNDFKHILVITTASLKTNWKKEISFFEKNEEISIISGSKFNDLKKWSILNYDIVDNFYKVAEEPVFEDIEVKDLDGNVVELLHKPVMVKNSVGKLVQKMKKSNKKADIKKALMESPLFQEEFDCVIIDEAHKLCNNTSIRYKVINDFLKKSNPKAVYLLTGTPVTKSAKDLYNVLSLIGAEITNDYQYYMEQYCGAEEHEKRDGSKYYTYSKEATNVDELREKIKHLYLRREIKDIGDMPKKYIIPKYYDLNDDQKYEYEKLWDDYVRAQESNENYTSEEYRQLIEGTIVRQFLAKEMIKNTIDLADTYIANGEKVVIMCNYNEEVSEISKHYGKKCVTFKGGMTSKKKDEAKDRFMNDPNCMVFIGNIVAASVGITLISSHILIFNSISWKEDDNRQAMDRIYRLNQTSDCQCYIQLFNDSISKDMYEKVLYKGFLMDSLVINEKDK